MHNINIKVTLICILILQVIFKSTSKRRFSADVALDDIILASQLPGTKVEYCLCVFYPYSTNMLSTGFKKLSYKG